MEPVKFVIIVLFVILANDSRTNLFKYPNICVQGTQCSLYLPACTSKYIGTRIAYYSNTTAIFQLRLLKSGDVSPNTGPEQRRQHLDRHFLTENERFVYDRSFLLRCNPLWRHHPVESFEHNLQGVMYDYDATRSNVVRVSRPVWGVLRGLGINSCQPTKRSKRGGSRKQRNISVICTTPRESNQVYARQTGVNHESLCQVKMSASNNDSKITLHLWNARSVRNKTVGLFDHIVENDVDMMVITEKWLSKNESAVIQEMKPPGYSFF